jgi:hypothetical protein
LFDRPAVPPVEAAEWLHAAVVGLVILSAGYEVWSSGEWPYYVPLSITAVLIPITWLMAQPLAENAWSRAETARWITALTVAVIALPLAWEKMLGRQTGRATGLALTLVVAAAGIVLSLSGTISYGQLALASAAALGPGALLVALGMARPFSPHLAPLLVLVLGGLLLAGHLYAGLLRLNAILLMAAPFGLWVGALPAVAQMRPWQRGLAQLTAVAVPTLAACALAAWKFIEASQSLDY